MTDPTPDSDPRPGFRRAVWRSALSVGKGRLIVQLLSLLIALALLVWCVSLAFAPENRERIASLRDAPPLDVAALLGLSLLSLLFNGCTFWATLRPVRRVSLADVMATNAVASFLGYLPLKLSIVSRVVIHHRRDAIPILTIGSWLAANAAIVLAVILPACAASLIHPQLDPAWGAIALGLWCVAFIGLTGGARLFAGEPGLTRMHAIARALHLPLIPRLLGSARFHHLHAGLSILSNRGAVLGATAFRVCDLLVQAGRFVLASRLLHVPLDPGTGVLVASTFFLLGVVSPAGAIGAREGGTTGLARLLRVPGVDPASTAVMALLVSATESIAFLVGALAGVAWIRPHRLFQRRGPHPSTHVH